MFAPLYLDNNASTQIDARVFEVMLPYLRERFGNASSRHEYGRLTRDAIDRARQQVAAAVGAHATEVVFTSGGSEANNLFVKGAAALLKPGVIAIGATEHPCVREPAKQLVRQGWSVLELPVKLDGHLDVEAAQELITAKRPMLVSQMLANNECGAVNDVAALSAVVKQAGGFLHSDAVQALGKIPVAFRELGVNAMTLSSHKIGGPIGAGALVLDKRLELQALIAGGGHERGLRSGTENVAAIVGFGAACELASSELGMRSANMRAARDLLEAGLSALDARVFGGVEPRLPNTSYFAFEGVDGDTLVGKLDRAGFAIASGAACSSANPEPSRTLLAMGVVPQLARGAVRVSMGATTKLEDVKRFLEVLRETLLQLRQLTAVSVE
ncbi:cysteine desulfurase family protein [Uliginosibacterium sp. H3]|uniref:Cysteine desulfurase family protein n=1 Tax=Uliginosibacterium silvisoli TaxID=3114758 RepID=A0ABU6KBH4_9RHOO|nr:cysteine desulfurase family protein [Uliginosibacterium sp. H3]